MFVPPLAICCVLASISWGVLLAEVQSIRNAELNPWTLLPGVFIVITVMSFNFLRNAADPYSRQMAYHIAVPEAQVGQFGRVHTNVGM